MTHLSSPADRDIQLRVRAVTDKVGWSGLQRQWEEILQDSDADGVFLSWPWMDTWMEIYGDGGEWLILVAENAEGRVLGIAPLMIETRRGVRYLLLLGQKADTASEYLGWILRRGHEGEAGAALARFLEKQAGKRWDVLGFDYVLEDSATLAVLKKWLGSASLEITPQTAAPFLSLPASWDEFLASRRAKFRQRWNRFHREHKVSVKIAGRDMSVKEGLEILQGLNKVRWGDARQSFLSDRYRRFHEKAAQRLQETGHLLLIFLEADGQIIAGRYDFVYGGKGWSFQGGWLPEWERQSAGKLILTAIMQWCCENGVREYDFLGGAASYKDDWSEGERKLVRVQAENPASTRVVLHRLQEKARKIKQRLGL